MNSFDIVWSIMGITSFLLFLIFYKKLKPSSFWSKMHPAEAWAMYQIILASPRVGGIMYNWIKGKHVDFSPILSIVVFITTGVVMMILARKVKFSILNDSLKDEVDRQVTKLGNK